MGMMVVMMTMTVFLVCTYSKGSSLTMPALERGNELYGFFRIDSGTFLKIESWPLLIIKSSTGVSGLFPALSWKSNKMWVFFILLVHGRDVIEIYIQYFFLNLILLFLWNLSCHENCFTSAFWRACLSSDTWKVKCCGGKCKKLERALRNM